MSTGPFDVHAAAIAAVGAASIEDPTRVHTNNTHLIGSIAGQLKKAELRTTQADVVQAVKTHYQHTDEVITGEAIVAIIRRMRLTEFRQEQTARRDHLTEQEQADKAEEWAAIRSWPCSECGAGAGERCWNREFGRQFGDNPPGHWARIKAAYQAGKAAVTN